MYIFLSSPWDLRHDRIQYSQNTILPVLLVQLLQVALDKILLTTRLTRLSDMQNTSGKVAVDTAIFWSRRVYQIAQFEKASSIRSKVA